MDIYHKKITDIVGENYVYASVLYYFGIKFYDYSEKTLEEVCTEKGLNIHQLITSLESVSEHGEEYDLQLIAYPVDLVIEYLKHAHHIFVKQQLPYLARLIENLEIKRSRYSQVAEDLKFVFPLFVEDFIHHIYEEEDSLFSHIMAMHKAIYVSKNPSKIFFELDKFSVEKCAGDHDVQDDEMRGLRQITRNYFLSADADLHIRVVFAELQSFEHNLQKHARIENEILFPKALMLEREAKNMVQEKLRLN